ncbi:MAG: hypothetical protein O8C64_08780 [Candidatus Methanoperedens sp.]|nr:hypothetical protein [Candidatus Methanoperedens sp.]MCZ7405569.1 hypothetical protein [Candidatus Methanoperedens sp.]
MAKKKKEMLDDISKFGKRVGLNKNQMIGNFAESLYTVDAAASMKETRRTGIGSDYEERTVNPLTGKKGRWRKVEIKSGGAKLSKLQKKTKNLKVIRY